jgi:hypothetical protein
MSGLRWLVSGTGRCGTGFIQQVLWSAGVQCTHEGIFRFDGEPAARARLEARLKNEDGVWPAEASWLAAPCLDWPELADTTIVHLVRNPKKVIDSQMRFGIFRDTGNQYYAYLNWKAHWLPKLREIEDTFHRAVYFYVEWNNIVAQHATTFHRVEDDARELLDKLGIDHEGVELFSNTTFNTRHGDRHSDVDLHELPDDLRVPLFEMAERYGYQV